MAFGKWNGSILKYGRHIRLKVKKSPKDQSLQNAQNRKSERLKKIGPYPKSLKIFQCCHHGDVYKKEMGPKYPGSYFCISQDSEVIHCLLS